MRISTTLLVVALGLSAHGLSAQEYLITKSSQTQFGGAMDFIVGIMGQGGPTIQKMFISAPEATVREDEMKDDKATESTITNFKTGDIYIIDHETKSYYLYNFGQMLASGPFGPGGMQPPTDSTYQRPDSAATQGAEYDVKVSVERRDGRQRILRWNARPMLITVTATPTKAPEGMSVDSMPIWVMLTEYWTSDDFPANDAMKEVSEQAVSMLHGATGLDSDAMSQAFSQNPQFQMSFEQNQEELEKMEGMPLKQVSSFLSLSPGATVNADSALYGSMGELKLDVAGAVASAVTSGIRGRLGRFGRRSEPEPKEEAGPPPVQILMFRVVEEVVGFEETLPASWNVVPSSYEMKPSPFQPRQ